MKPINEMSLKECIDRLYDVVGHGYDRKGVEINVLELADRIDTLLYEQAQRHDARVDALENEINALRAKHRWIPVEERMPDDVFDYVHVYYDGMVATMCYSKEKGFHGSTANRMEMFSHEITHWRRIDTPDIATPSGQVAGMGYE
jgi:hypothetical protein